MANQRVIEILLQLKQSGREAIDQVKSAIKDLVNPANLASGAMTGFGRAGQTAINGITARIAVFQRDLKSGELAVKAVSAGMSASLRAVAVAGELAWGAITFGVSGVIKVFSTLFSFLNPFKLQGILTGAALGGTGYLAKEWIEAADGAETYRKRLGIVINDQAIANRIFSDFEDLSQKSGIEAESLSSTFTRLYDLRVRDAQAATTTLAGVAALLQTDIGELTDILNNPNSRGLSRFGINLDDLGKQVRLQSGNITKLVDNTEQAVRQGVIDLLAEKFPNALAVAGQSFATQMAIFRVNLGQFAQDFGAILLPAAVSALTRINKFLADNRDQIVATIRSIPEIASIVYQEISRLLDSGKIATTLAPLAEPVLKLVGNLLDNILRIIVAGFKLMAVPLVAVWRVALAELQTAWEIFAQNLIPTLINSVKHNITAAANDPTLRNLLDTLIPGAGDLAAAAQNIPDVPVKSLGASAQDFLGKLDVALDQSVKDAKGATGELAGAFKDLFDYLRHDAGDVGNTLTALFGPQFTQIVRSVQGTLEKMRAQAQQSRSGAAPTIAPAPVDDTTLAKIQTLQLGTTFEEQRAAIRDKYNQQLQEYRNLLSGREHGDELYLQVSRALHRKELEELQEVDRQKAISAQQAAVAATTGIQQMVAQNNLSYQQDLSNWQKRLDAGEIDSEQFVQIQEALQRRLAQQNQALADQQQAAQEQAQQLILQSQHRFSEAQLQQIDADAQARKVAVRKQYDDGLLDEQAYNASLQAIDRESNEKRLDINGTFFDGLRSGFQTAADQMKTQAQIGKEIANDFADGFADAFANIVTGSQSAAQAFKNFAVSILGDIAKIIAKQAILSLFGGAFNGAFSGGFSRIATILNVPGGNTGGLLQFKNLGGLIRGFLGGGFVPGGGPDRDSVPAMLTPGEFVVRRRVVAQPGALDFLQGLNAGRVSMRAAGGLLGTAPLAGMPGSAGAAGGVQVLPVAFANEANMRTMLANGRNAFIDFMRQNKGPINGALQ